MKKKKKKGRFYCAIKKYGKSVKVDSTREKVEEWFMSKGKVLTNLVWIEGYVDAEDDFLTYHLSEENPNAKLSEKQKDILDKEITCYVQFHYGKIKGMIIPGSMKATLIDLLEAITTRR